jgi:hypothetical protein
MGRSDSWMQEPQYEIGSIDLLIIEEGVYVRLKGTGREAGFPISVFSIRTMGILIVMSFDHPILTVGPQLSNFFLVHISGLLY